MGEFDLNSCFTRLVLKDLKTFGRLQFVFTPRRSQLKMSASLFPDTASVKSHALITFVGFNAFVALTADASDSGSTGWRQLGALTLLLPYISFFLLASQRRRGFIHRQSLAGGDFSALKQINTFDFCY